MDEEQKRLLEIERGEKAQRVLSNPYFDAKCTEIKNAALADFIQSDIGEQGDSKRREAHYMLVALEMLRGKFHEDAETARMAAAQLAEMKKSRPS